jgi:hypothetical protein
MVVNGFIVSVDESYNSLKDEDGLDKQMMLNVEILVRSTIYLGREDQNNLKSIFIH